MVVEKFFVSRGYIEASSGHAHEWVFDKPDPKGRSDKALRVRLRLRIQSTGAWTLAGTPLGVENWHASLESETVLLQGANQVQGFLDEIKRRVESGR